VNGRPLKAERIEFNLLRFFLQNPRRIHSRQRILNEVWSESTFIEERTVDVHVRRLRILLLTSGHEGIIETIRYAGYKLRDEKDRRE
jgi:two-component system phosphate regulon response regulator PhoB